MPEKPDFFLLSVFLFACKSDNTETAHPLFFETASVLKRSGEACDLPESECARISLFFPKATGSGAVSEEINDHITGHIIQLVSAEEDPQIASLQELADRFIMEYESTKKDFEKEPAWETYLFSRIYLQSEQLLSIGFNTEVLWEELTASEASVF